jgi:AcrR family transcriptional regulator
MGTRDDILDAAAKVMRTQGFARATTKSIAQVAGYSEAALYKHFDDKAAILLAVMHERMPQLPSSLMELIGNPGTGTVRANLTRLARTAIDFYIDGFPILVSLFSSQELLTAHRRRMQELNAGPHKAQEGLILYLREEQKLGRIRRTADVEAAAALLFGACFQRGFEVNFTGVDSSDDERNASAGALAKTLYESLQPVKAGGGRPGLRSRPAR